MKKFFLSVALITEIITCIYWLTAILIGYLFVLLVTITEIEKNFPDDIYSYKFIGYGILISVLYFGFLITLICSIIALIKLLKGQSITVFYKILILFSLVPIYISIKFILHL